MIDCVTPGKAVRGESARERAPGESASEVSSHGTLHLKHSPRLAPNFHKESFLEAAPHPSPDRFEARLRRGAARRAHEVGDTCPEGRTFGQKGLRAFTLFAYVTL